MAQALVAVGGIAAAVSLRPARVAPTGATDAWEALKAEERCVLVDIRPKSALKDEGVVDLKEANKKPLGVVYAEPDEEGDLAVDPEFTSTLQQAAGISEESIVILLDSDGTLAPKAAEELARDGFFKEKVYWVRGGMEGTKGWKASELPTKPYRVFELPLPSLELPSVDLAALAAELQAQVQAQVPEVDLTGTLDRVNGAVNVITDKYKENPSAANGVLAAAGIAAVGVLAVTELDAILQLMGALGLARFLAGNLLFAKDREATLASVRAFLKERGFDVPTGASNSSGAAGSGAGAAAASGSSGSSATADDGGGAQLQQLADIVMGAKDADSAAQQIADTMVPEVRGVDREALAAALEAAGFQLSLPPSLELDGAAAAVAERPATDSAAAAATAPAVAEAISTLVGTPAGAEPVSAAVTEPAAAAEPVSAAVTEPIAAAEPVTAAVTEPAAAVEPVTAAVTEPAAAAEPVTAAVTEPVAAAEPVTAAVTESAAGSKPVPTTLTVHAAEEPVPVAAAAAMVAVAPELPVATPATEPEAPSALPVPANVAEAREWIAAWKRRGSEAAAADVTASPLESSAEAATEAKATEAKAEEATGAKAAAEAEAAEELMPESSGSLLDDGVESALAPANVVAAREWIASWKMARAQQQEVREEQVAAEAALVAGDGASDSEPPAEVAAEVVEERATVSVVA
ncbi:hypothetical protein PLESTF_001559600 [Pleodorina starrii]|nr:hypothetical protein PLESTF_001559600 [Pleodorina starrii]